MGRDGGDTVASEGRLVENPLLSAAGSGRKGAGVRKAAALFDTTSLWAVGMLRRYAVSVCRVSFRGETIARSWDPASTCAAAVVAGK